MSQEIVPYRRKKDSERYVSKEKEQALLEKAKNPKHRLIMIIMFDAGLRVSEAVQLQIQDFDFKRQLILVKSLKKRKGEILIREIPLTERLLRELAGYWKNVKDKNPHAYLFPSPTSESGHLGRKAVWAYINRLDKTVHPHLLRHTFATRLTSQSKSFENLRAAQKMLGHKSITTTQIYTHAEIDELRKAVKGIEQTKSLFIRVSQWLFGKQALPVIHIDNNPNQFIIGRNQELAKIHENSLKKVHTILLGKQGTGKTNILDNLQIDKSIRIDEMTSVKRTVANLLLYLIEGDKEDIGNMLFKNADMKKRLERESVNNMIDLLKQVTEKDEYTLIIDKFEDLTKKGISVFNQLKSHFHIITAAREVPIAKAHVLTNFDKIRLDNLSRHDAILLIDKLSDKFKNSIEDYNHYQTHILNESQNNPQFITELVERLGKEGFVSIDKVSEYRHNAGLKEVDVSLFVVVLLSSLMILRYLGMETGESSYKLIGGAFLLFALFARPLLNAGKRKYL